jgi:hypothetical protein
VRSPLRLTLGATAVLLALCAGGAVLVSRGTTAVGVVLLVLAGVAALIVVPFLLLLWLYYRGERELERHKERQRAKRSD